MLAVPLAGADPGAATRRPRQETRLELATPSRHRITPASEAPSIDGRLGDRAWEEALEIELRYETYPRDNASPPVRTVVFLTFDERHLYVGFRAFDTEPGRIRAHLTDRDTIFEDDHVGIAFDTFNDDRRAFEFFVNPLGVQMDRFRDGVGGRTDLSWDAIWYSAGKLSDHGYEVELAIPFQSIRFQNTRALQTWGFEAIRSYPRSQRRSFRSQPRDRSNDCHICQYSELSGFSELSRGRDLEITPTLVAGRSDELDPRTGSFDITEEAAELGLTVRWGFTPSLTLNGTFNPDFSQVEADVAQLEVNRRFALFFPERRPFFLEGADVFQTSINAVHTRSIADPDWGVKVTGKQGRLAIGGFLAEDARTSLLFPGSQSSQSTTLNQRSSAGVLRLRHDIGAASAVGLLLSDREGTGYSNRVGGIDGFFRLGAADSIRLQALRSQTRYPAAIREEFDQPAGTFSDRALSFDYRHDDRLWSWDLSYDDVGEHFRADLGFLPRVDRRRAEAGVERTWWGEADEWWTTITIGSEWGRTEDQSGQELNEGVELDLRLSGPLQSFLGVGGELRTRYFGGVEFEERRQWLRLHVRPSAQLAAGLGLSFGDDVDFAHTRAGSQLRLDPSIQLSVGRHVRLGLSHTHERLDVDPGRLFTASLSRLRLVYQFNLRTFVRAVVQYRDVERDPELFAEEVEARSRELFNQLLFSYKVNPRTVLFLGYSDQLTGDEESALRETDRAVFLKLGYAWLL